MDIVIPELRGTFRTPEKQMHPYTHAEQAMAFPRLSGKSLYINHAASSDGAKTADRLVVETLGSHGVKMVESVNEAQVVVWVRGGSNENMYAFVVADPFTKSNYLATECGPIVLTATIMSAVCEFFSVLDKPLLETEIGKLVAEITELNRELTGAGLEGNINKARRLMIELKKPVEKLGNIRSTESVKPVIDALGDSVQVYVDTGFPEAYELARTSYDALCNIGNESIPWLEKGAKNSSPAVKKWCNKALKEIRGTSWWKW